MLMALLYLVEELDSNSFTSDYYLESGYEKADLSMPIIFADWSLVDTIIYLSLSEIGCTLEWSLHWDLSSSGGAYRTSPNSNSWIPSYGSTPLLTITTEDDLCDWLKHFTYVVSNESDILFDGDSNAFPVFIPTTYDLSLIGYDSIKHTETLCGSYFSVCTYASRLLSNLIDTLGMCFMSYGLNIIFQVSIGADFKAHYVIWYGVTGVVDAV